MRKVNFFQISIVMSIFTINLLLSLFLTQFIYEYLIPNEFRALLSVLISAILFFSLMVISFRGLLSVAPHPEGVIKKDSPEEFVYHIYLLFYLLFFHSFMRTQVFPLPLKKLLLITMGAKMGTNSFTAGVIYDPMFIRVGENCLLGHNSLLAPHIIEGEQLKIYKIIIADQVTIGVNTVIYGGTEIGKGAQIMSGAIVKPFTKIRPYEVWGGVPAKLIRRQDVDPLLTIGQSISGSAPLSENFN